MACTRFKYDDARTKKELQQATDPGRWILNVPGNGSDVCFIEDPQIIPQKWGANVRTNTINLESDLKGVNRLVSRDCLGKDEYQKYDVPNQPISYPTCNQLFTDQSRATHPAWWYRDLEQPNFEYPPLNPQVNTCFPFQNNLSTRILEKDYFTPKRDCMIIESKTYISDTSSLPVNYQLIRGGYPGGPTTCAQTNSCENV